MNASDLLNISSFGYKFIVLKITIGNPWRISETAVSAEVTAHVQVAEKQG
jgi:hypothetical protein